MSENNKKNYTIRAMEESDYPGLKALWMTIHGFGIRSIDDSEELRLTKAARSSAESFAATMEEEAVFITYA